MLNKSIKFLIENKLVAVLLLVFFIGWGIINAPFDWQLKWLPRNPVAVDAIPDIGENQQIVFTKWSGRSPQDIEDQITYPLTTSLLGVPGVKTIRSSSAFGFSSIYIIFEEEVDFYWSRSRILEKLNSLPKDVLPEGIQPTLGPDATGLGQIFWYTLEGRDEEGNVTGGWDLHELRSIQDYYVKYGLASSKGVSEVASIGGYVQEYQIDVDPNRLKEYNIPLQKIVEAVKNSNRDIGARTIEINQVEYIVRGLGYVKQLSDIENAVIIEKNNIPVLIKDIARVTLGPAARRGILDKEGAEVVGGVVIARYGANPMEVITNVKEKIKEISNGLPSKILKDGRKSQVTVVPFYDRSHLIKETLSTLNLALLLEILVTVLVIIIMVMNLRASLLISSLLPVAILMVFIAMKTFNIDANIVALSGIAIAIGTMVDVGVILSENIIRHIEEDRRLNLDERKEKREKREEINVILTDSENENKPLPQGKVGMGINQIVYNATTEVSGAIVTAVLTTIISFIPVFTMVGAEGKLFRPLAFTKTFALIASLFVALILIPPFAAMIFKESSIKKTGKLILNIALVFTGFLAIYNGFWLGLVLIAFAIYPLLKHFQFLPFGDLPAGKAEGIIKIVISVIAIILLLTKYWQPLGVDISNFWNLLFVIITTLGLLWFFTIFRKYYTRILTWALANKMLFLTIPIAIFIAGMGAWSSLGKEFMPALNEGSFLLMPTSLPHAGVEENKRVLQQLDMAVASIPEIETVVGKAGRIESALDPAPLSMYENLINYKSEYVLDDDGKRLKFKVNNDGLFELKGGNFIADGNNSNNENVIASGAWQSHNLKNELIQDTNGKFFRQWRKHIKNPDDIWEEILKVTKLSGVTSAPKLQPIQTRLIMLQTGMRAPMGIKIKGQNLQQIEAFGLELESILKQVKGVKKEAVFADRIIGKPYLLIDINREKAVRYGLNVNDIQQVLEVAIGGKTIGQTVEGRERYSLRVRYPRELRNSPESLKEILIPTKSGNQIPLGEVVDINYEQGAQVIKSEDTFLVGYVLFDKLDDEAEVDVVERAQEVIQHTIDNGNLIVPQGISYRFTGTYENQIRAEKKLVLVVPLALAIIFLILYFQFKSVSTSLLVFSGIAVAFAGGFILIWLYGQDWFLNFDLLGKNMRDVFQMHTINLSVAIWVGFIALFGIATDDGVIMATYLTQIVEKKKPKTKAEIRASVIEAGEKRIRPCLMTTATTILALLPVLMSSGRGSDIMIPMAIPSFGGMLVALITLFVVPVLYSWKSELKIKKEEL